MLPFGAGRLVGFVGNHHKQDVGTDVAAGFFRRLHHPRGGGGEGGRGVDPFAEAEVVVSVPGGERHTGVALPGADHFHRLRRLRADAAVVHREVVAFKVAAPGSPQVAQDLDIFGEIVVAAGEVVVARPDAHLLVFRLLPAGHQIDAKAAAGDRVDSRGHARDDRRGQRQRGGGGVDLNARSDGRQSGHQGERL